MQNCLVVVVAVFVVAVPFSSTPDKNLFLEAENFCLEHLDMSMSFKTFKEKILKTLHSFRLKNIQRFIITHQCIF